MEPKKLFSSDRVQTAGWSARRKFEPVAAGEPEVTVSERFVRTLEELGVRQAFGIVGGANAAFADALGRSPIEMVHCRHEGGAAFAAVEAHFAAGHPTVLFVTTGPGLLNALTGISAARWEGAELIVVSGVTAAKQRGRWATQETSGYTLPVSGLFTPGPLFHYAAVVEDPAELEKIAMRLRLGLARPNGFVAHIALPIAIQMERAPAIAPRRASARAARCSIEEVTECAELLKSGSFAIWVGFGARSAARPVLELARRTGAPVLSSPRGKGIFPEDHPQFVGVTGVGGHDSVYEYLTRSPPDRILVLGTRMGESTSFWHPGFAVPHGFIHVDLDPEVPGAAFPGAHTLGIQAEIRSFVTALVEHFLEAPDLSTAVRMRPADEPELLGTCTPVRPSYLMQAIQRLIIDSSDAVVMTESGNAFAWGNNRLQFSEPGRYRVSTGFGSMGHFSAGVVGAALARRSKCVAIVGDGAFLMNNEINTAVQYRAPAVWIVLNDARYNMVEQGMRALGFTPKHTELPPLDCVMMARSMGADGVRVESEQALEAALALALDCPGPFVVDVVIDPREPSPVLRRIESLSNQGASAKERETSHE